MNGAIVPPPCRQLIGLLRGCRLKLSAAGAARTLGFSSPAGLHQWIRGNGLPPFSLLRNWVYVIELLRQERRGVSLAHWALDRDVDPAVYYRFVLRVTGQSWGRLKTLGWEWAVATANQVWSPFLSPTSTLWLGVQETMEWPFYDSGES